MPDRGSMPVTSGPMSADGELVEHVDPEGRVLEVVTRGEMRQRLLRHRCTYVAVVTSERELVVHRRADWKDVYPGWWDVFFGGVCGVGEDWEDAAARELAEEAGLALSDLASALSYLGPANYEGFDGLILGRLYLAVADAEPTCPDGEVVAIDRIPLSEIESWFDGRSVCFDSVAAWPTVAGHLNII